MPGAEHAEVRTLRSAESARELRAAARGGRSVLVVGAGFIGCEAAVSLSRLGPQVTVLCPEALPQRERLGEEAGTEILRWLKSEGVSVLTGTKLLGIDAGHRVRTDLVPMLDADVVLLATGISPRTGLAEDAAFAGSAQPRLSARDSPCCSALVRGRGNPGGSGSGVASAVGQSTWVQGSLCMIARWNIPAEPGDVSRPQTLRDPDD